MKIVIIGYGSRGVTYAELYKNKAEIVAVCDIRQERLALAANDCMLDKYKLFTNEQAFFNSGKMGDLCVIATPDDCHKRHALAALEAGYDLQLEKPIACTRADCEEIFETAERLERRIFVCHVLRYAPFFAQIQKELRSGIYGEIATVNVTENVAYWHQAHSYVRGNWRDSYTSSPMIVAKSCHDLDILVWLIDKPCKSVSSMGSLSYFTLENAPENSSDRCVSCSVKSACQYNAERFYMGRLKRGQTDWPVNVLASEPSTENIAAALRTGPYGRCVFRCDNNVVDHQIVNMEFDGGITAHLTMTAFSEKSFREIHVHCVKGEIYGNMADNVLTCNVFGRRSKKINIKTLNDRGFAHGGGDYRMVEDILGFYSGKPAVGLTEIEKSIVSHRIGFAAEESRRKGGALVEIAIHNENKNKL